MPKLGRSAWALIDQSVVSAANFVSSLLIAKTLAPTALAAYALAITTAFGIFTVHRAWIVQPYTILGVVESPQRRWLRYANIFQAQWRVMPFCALVFGVVGWSFFPTLGLIFGGTLYVILLCLQEIVRRYWYTEGLVSVAFPFDLLAYGGQLFALLLFWSLSALDLNNCFLVMSVPLAISTIWMAIKIGVGAPETKNGKEKPSASEDLVEHWHHAKWVVMSQLVWIGATQLIPFQLSAYAKPEDVAGYHAVNTILNALNVIRLTIGNYLPSRSAVILHESGSRALSMYLKRVALGVVAFAFVGVFFAFVAGDWVMALVFGSRYEEAAKILPLLSAVNLFALLALVFAAGAQVLGTSRVMFTSNLVAMAICLLLGPALLGQLGIWGAVAIAAIGLLVPTLWQGIRLYQDLRVH